jgi:hypothetical protein
MNSSLATDRHPSIASREPSTPFMPVCYDRELRLRCGLSWALWHFVIEGESVGLFQKKTDAQTKVENHASLIANAVWNVASGINPPDFVDFTVDGCRDQLRRDFQRLTEEQGEQKALKIALKRARVVAQVDPNRIPGLERQIESVMRSALGTT